MRIKVLAIVVALALYAAALVGGMTLDERTDRSRPMYADIERMALLQYTAHQDSGALVAVTVEPDQTVDVAGSEFTTSEGVSLEVEVTEDGYCIRADNAHGDSTRWQCLDGATRPDTHLVDED